MMKKSREFDNILDGCLERMLVRGETIGQCLAGHPEYAAELEPLLRTALAAKEATAIKPRPEFRERASYQFQAALREMESKKRRGFVAWQPQWVTAVIVVVVLLLAGSGTVAAANNSLPDEPLYQVKLATEAVRLQLTPSALGKAELYAKLADKRVDEIIRMADKGKAEQVERTTQRLNAHLVAMANLPVLGGEEGVPVDIMRSEAEQPQMAAEEAPMAQLGEEERVTVREVAPLLVPEPAPPPAVEEAPVAAAPRAPGPPESAGPGKGQGGKAKDVKPDKQAELRSNVSYRAVENIEALQEQLERAPESVKPALRRAIEVAGNGYGQALRNLD